LFEDGLVLMPIIYRDSARNDAMFAGGGVFWKPAGGLRLGGGLADAERHVQRRRPFHRPGADEPARLLADGLALRRIDLGFAGR
jgi:hypothetical protein